MSSMTEDTHDFLTELFNEYYNSLKANIFHLRHQFDLPPKHRVIDMDDVELANQIEALEAEESRLYAVKKELKELKPPNKPPWEEGSRT